MDRTQKTPYAFVVKDFGLFIAADKSLVPLASEMADGSVAVRMHAHRFGGVLGLSKREQEFINNWESEAFRKKLVGGEGKGELSNRIADRHRRRQRAGPEHGRRPGASRSDGRPGRHRSGRRRRKRPPSS